MNGDGVKPGQHRLLGLEAGRFLAALLVTAFHFSLAFQNLRNDAIFGMAFRGGHAGVDYFFVLSGFIIYYIHRNDINRPDKITEFAKKRFFRIYPLYWAIFAAMLAMFILVPSLQGKRSLSILNLALDGFLLPKGGDSIVLQSWSLRHEIVFYAFFGIAIFNGRIGAVILIAWQIACLVIGSMYPDNLNLIIKPFFYIYNLGFGAGIAAAWASEHMRFRLPGAIAALGAIGFVIALVVEWKIGQGIPESQLPLGNLSSPLIYMTCSMMVIFGLTQFEKNHQLPAPKLLKLLGGCSYCLYLIHAPLGSVMIRVFALRPLNEIPNSISFVLIVAAAVIASIVAHVWIERPVLSYLRRRFISRRVVDHVSTDDNGALSFKVPTI